MTNLFKYKIRYKIRLNKIRGIRYKIRLNKIRGLPKFSAARV